MEQNRPPNTTRSGEHFDATIIERVWQKGTLVPPYPSTTQGHMRRLDGKKPVR